MDKEVMMEKYFVDNKIDIVNGDSLSKYSNQKMIVSNIVLLSKFLCSIDNFEESLNENPITIDFIVNLYEEFLKQTNQYSEWDKENIKQPLDMFINAKVVGLDNNRYLYINNKMYELFSNHKNLAFEFYIQYFQKILIDSNLLDYFKHMITNSEDVDLKSSKNIDALYNELIRFYQLKDTSQNDEYRRRLISNFFNCIIYLYSNNNKLKEQVFNQVTKHYFKQIEIIDENKVLISKLFNELCDQIDTNDDHYINSINEQKITEVETIAKSRRGQNRLRGIILKKYNSEWIISKIKIKDCLIASHILPWNKFPKERLKWTNLLLLSSSIDKLFDRNLISFDENGYLFCSKKLKQNSNWKDDLLKIGIQVEYIERKKSLFDELKKYQIKPTDLNLIKDNIKQHYRKVIEEDLK